LLRALLQRFDVPVVCIEAGAGFGKSTLLVQAARENSLAPRGRDAWLTCEPPDASATSLLSGIVATLGGAVDPEVDVTTAAEAMWAASPVAVALLLDDVHLVASGSAGEAVLAALIEALPANGHLVLAGRRMPALPLARLAAQGRLVRITEDDLRFSDEELAEYAHRADVDVVQLEPAAGWPALVALRASARPDDTRAFVLEQLVAGLDPALRHVLAVAALLGGGDEDLLSKAAGEPADADELGAIPLVERTPGRTVHVHALWNELLVHELDDAQRAEARRRAAELLAERGAYGQAFELLADSQLWADARALVVDACLDQGEPPGAEQLRRWQSLIPANQLGPGPAALIDALVARADAPWSIEARDHFARAIAGFASVGDALNELRVGFRAVYVAWKREDGEEIDVFLRRLEELGDRVPDSRRVWAMNRALRADVDGDDERVLELLADIDTLGLEPRVAYFVPLLRTDARLGMGLCDAAVEAATEAGQLAAGLAPAAGALSACLRPALARWCAGEGAALHHAVLANDPGPGVARDERAEVLAWGAIAAVHRGDARHSHEELRTLEAIIEPVEPPERLRGLVALARATDAVATADEWRALAELRAVLDPEQPNPGTSWRAVLWQPGTAAVLDADLARSLDGMVAGAGGRAVLDAAARIRALRADEPAAAAGAVLDSVDAVVTALPLPLGIELAAGALGEGDDRANAVIEHYVESSPAATRDALQRLATTPGRAARAARDLLAVLPIPPDEPVRVEVLGAARLVRGGVVVDDADWRRERVRALLLLLVVKSELRREEAAALLWPDLDERKAAANLRLTLHYLQSILEPRRAGREAPYFVSQDTGFLRLRGEDRLTVDAWELAALLDEAKEAETSGALSHALELLLAATRLWRGEPYEDVAFAEWAAPSREWLHARCVAAGVRAGELLLGGGRPDEALELIERVLRAEPWSEAAYRVQVSAHLAAGNRAAALRALDACRAMLAELGAEPDDETEMLSRRVTTASR
jgi:DNA-binding SARP family transcriptional activator